MQARAVNNPSAATAGLSIRLAIALAFADASVAVLALPQIVERLHTSISHVTWVITAYNLALIASTVVMVPFADGLASRRALVSGLVIFGLASLGSGLAGSLPVLVVWRCVQGAGAGLLLCASLPLFAGERRGAGATLQSWAATAAFGRTKRWVLQRFARRVGSARRKDAWARGGARSSPNSRASKMRGWAASAAPPFGAAN